MVLAQLQAADHAKTTFAQTVISDSYISNGKSISTSSLLQYTIQNITQSIQSIAIRNDSSTTHYVGITAINGYILYTNDLTQSTWTTYQLVDSGSNPITTAFQKIVYVNNVFVILGANGFIAYSTAPQNGNTSWSHLTLSELSTSTLYDIVYGNNLFTIISYTGTTSSETFYITTVSTLSTTESDYTTTSYTASTYGSQNIAFAENKFILVSFDGTIRASSTPTDSSSWTTVASLSISSPSKLYSFNNTYYITYHTNDTYGICYNKESISSNWTKLTTTTSLPTQIVSIANDTYIGINDNNIYISTAPYDIESYRIIQQSPENKLLSIASSGSKFVIVGENGICIYCNSDSAIQPTSVQIKYGNLEISSSSSITIPTLSTTTALTFTDAAEGYETIAKLIARIQTLEHKTQAISYISSS